MEHAIETATTFSIDEITLLIGIIFVIVYSYERFNNPASNRSSTTAVRYHLAALAYTATYLCIFYILSRYPSLIEPMLSGASDEIQNNFKNLPSALVVALLLTGFLQKIPLLSQLDQWLRDKLQYLAAIPFEVRRLAKQLYLSEFNIDDKVQNQVFKRLREEGLMCSDIDFKNHSETFALWNKASVLMYHLSHWSEQRKTSAYMSIKLNEFKHIKTHYNQLAELAKSCMVMCSDSQTHPENNPAFAELIKTFHDQCRALIRNQCLFISHGTLRCSYTRKSRRELLLGMGFQLSEHEDESGLSVNQMATLFVTLVAGFLLAIILFGSRFEGTTHLIRVITLVVTMNMVAVATVVYTKGKWAISQPDAQGNRPVFYYLVIALTAVVISIPVTVIFKAIFEITTYNQPIIEALIKGWDGFLDRSYPWKLMIFSTALCLAYQLDTKSIASISYPNMRWIEGALQALVALAAAYIVHPWVVELNPHLSPVLDPVTGERKGLWLDSLMVRSGVIGFAIGCTIPYWFKVSPKLGDEPLEESDTMLDGSNDTAMKNA